MTDEVVNEVVRRVLAAMQQRGLGADAAVPQTRALGTQSVPTPPSARPLDRANARAIDTYKKVFLTADMLQRRLATDDSQGRAIVLAHNEFLTPAAMDLAAQRHLTISRKPKPLLCAVETAELPPTNTNPAPAVARLGFVVCQSNNLVRGILESLERNGILAVDFNRTDSWIVNTSTLCEAVVSGALTGGVVMVPLAAEAVILANKVRGIRAMQGVRPEGLASAMARLAPNVLVLEHSSSTFHEIRTMLGVFATGGLSGSQEQTVIDAIEKLERA